MSQDGCYNEADNLGHLKQKAFVRKMEAKARVSVAGHVDIETKYTREMARADGALLERWLNSRGIATYGRKDFLFGRGRRKSDSNVRRNRKQVRPSHPEGDGGREKNHTEKTCGSTTKA